MKLYFYFLDTRKDNCIRMEECEVVEKAMAYVPVNRFPKYYTSNSVWKSEIGKITGTTGKVVILTEGNALIAADIFAQKCRDDISHLQSVIWAKEQQMEEINSIRLRIEKWRSENARK